MGAGEIYAAMGQNLGKTIANSMEQYHKEHVAYDQQAQLADALSRMGVDATGQITPLTGQDGKPVKDVQPIINSKAYDSFKSMATQNRAAATGAMQALNHIALQSIGHAATAAGPDRDALVAQRNAQTQLIGARTTNVGARTQKTQLEVAQQLGLIPKTAAAPTGGQIMKYQVDQQKIAISGRDKIAKALANQNINDPTSLLDTSQWVYGTNQNQGVMGSGLGPGQTKFVPNAKPNDYVQIPGVRNPMPVKQAMGLQKQAVDWQKLHQQAQQQPLAINPPAQSIQRLMQNPTPQTKAMFDQVYGQGASDIVLKSQGTPDPNAQTPNAAPPQDQPEDTSGEETDQ